MAAKKKAVRGYSCRRNTNATGIEPAGFRGQFQLDRLAIAGQLRTTAAETSVSR
jgi:hypothetical protein